MPGRPVAKRHQVEAETRIGVSLAAADVHAGRNRRIGSRHFRCREPAGFGVGQGIDFKTARRENYLRAVLVRPEKRTPGTERHGKRGYP